MYQLLRANYTTVLMWLWWFYVSVLLGHRFFNIQKQCYILLGHIYFPTVLQGKELLYLTVVNHLMSTAAHDGPHGHSSRGSIRLRPLPKSPWLLHLGKHLCCASWSTKLWKGCSLLHWWVLVLFHWPSWKWDPWSQVALKRAVLPSIHPSIHPFIHSFIQGHLFRLPLRATLSYSQQHSTSRGEKYSREEKICFFKAFLYLGALWKQLCW